MVEKKQMENGMKELSLTEIEQVSGGFWSLIANAGARLYNAHQTYANSSIVDHDVDVGVAP